MALGRTGRLTTTATLVTLALAVSPAAITPPKISFTDTRLSNGLRLIVAEDHVAPVFSIAVIYNVGSRDERPGRTGFAHLFEHMMFKGPRTSDRASTSTPSSATAAR
jgi:predicted Zn-dependent peptidase